MPFRETNMQILCRPSLRDIVFKHFTDFSNAYGDNVCDILFMASAALFQCPVNKKLFKNLITSLELVHPVIAINK